MNPSISELPRQMSPYITMTRLDEPVLVTKGPFRLAGHGEGTLESDLSFHWLSTPRFQFEGSYSASHISLDPQVWTLEAVGSMDFTASAHILETTHGPDSARVRGVVTGDWAVGVEPFDVMRFSLLNFPDYIGAPVRHGPPEAEGWVRGRLETSTEGDRCRIDPIADVAELRKQSAREPGFVISHVGEWVPSSGSLTASEALKTLEMLHFWFGFLKGDWAGPVFPQGLVGGEVVWRHFAPWKLGESRSVSTWLPERTPIDDDLGDLFSGFVQRWRDPAWKNPLLSAISWFVEANARRSALEVKTILCQVALELLAWVHMVETQRLHSRADFAKISAAGRIRALLHHIHVPTEIPTYATNLGAVADDEAFDGPGVITRIRNALVHATEKNRDKTKQLGGTHFLECSQLALRYLELAILGVCAHSGRYAQRGFKGWKGDDEIVVPWANHAMQRTGGAGR